MTSRSPGRNENRRRPMLGDYGGWLAVCSERRTRGSNPQPITGQLISNQPANHSLILRAKGMIAGASAEVKVDRLADGAVVGRQVRRQGGGCSDCRFVHRWGSSYVSVFLNPDPPSLTVDSRSANLFQRPLSCPCCLKPVASRVHSGRGRWSLRFPQARCCRPCWPKIRLASQRLVRRSDYGLSHRVVGVSHG